MRPRPFVPRVTLRGLLAAALPLLLLAGCAPSEEDVEATREEVRAVLTGYLDGLARVYAGESPTVLEGWAAQKELLGIAKRVEDLTAEGRRLEPELRELTIEELNVWSHSNAYVTTLEVWDLRVYSTGVDRLLSEELGQTNRVKYQLKRDERDGREGWIVLFRSRVE